MLDGVFAFILYDETKNIVYAARDHLGIRALYMGQGDETFTGEADGEVAVTSANNKTGNIAFASEAKAFNKHFYLTSENIVKLAKKMLGK